MMTGTLYFILIIVDVLYVWYRQFYVYHFVIEIKTPSVEVSLISTYVKKAFVDDCLLSNCWIGKHRKQ